jgi:pyrroline-5-carboxylate reductase
MKIAFIGGGKMAEAILAALVESGASEAGNICVADVSVDRRSHIESTYGVSVSEDNARAASQAEIVILAVKPQQLGEVLAGLSDLAEGKLFISIAAGKLLSGIAAALGSRNIVRVMPNIAALASASMNVFCADAEVSDEDKAHVATMLSSFGEVLELPEEQFDAITALSGSGPAFFTYMLKAMAEGAEALGLSAEAAEKLAIQTFLGTARLLAEGHFEADALIQAVSSAKGTTVAGMDVLSRSSLPADIAQTLEAAAARSRELSQ